jgi:hypothetical protein
VQISKAAAAVKTSASFFNQHEAQQRCAVPPTVTDRTLAAFQAPVLHIWHAAAVVPLDHYKGEAPLGQVLRPHLPPPKCPIRPLYPKFEQLLDLSKEHGPARLFTTRLFDRMTAQEEYTVGPHGRKWAERPSLSQRRPIMAGSQSSDADLVHGYQFVRRSVTCAASHFIILPLASPVTLPLSPVKSGSYLTKKLC